MRRRSLALALLVIATLLVSGLVPAAAATPQAESLIQIVIQESIDLSAVEVAGVPVYARLTGGDGTSYLLAGGTSDQVATLRSQDLAVAVLDPDLRGASYYLVYPGPGRERPDWSAYGRLLLDDGTRVLVRATPQDAERLAGVGAEIVRVTLDPKPLGPSSPTGILPTSITPDPMIQLMMDQVNQTNVYSYTGGLSGEWPVDIGGSPYTIVTRHTASGTPIQQATQFVYEHLAGLGLDTEYQNWNSSGYSGRNVIGELPGLVNPDDIFIICAHVDDMPPGGIAPGADDNGSGTVAVLMAADILTQYQWGCTLRFALWTGEEQGLLGSHAYAQAAYNAGENIVGVLNFDMIAWDELYGPDIDLHADSDLPETLVLAQLFADVVDAYDLNLIPEIIANGTGASDHASFWQYGYTAILGIEDYYPNYHDFNDYYHTVNDKLQYLNMPYYTQFVKAAVGAFAHMSGCLIPGGTGAVDGHVTAASGGAPLADATVTLTDQDGHSMQTTTDGSGYYTQTLLSGIYTVTAEAYAYLPAVVTDVVVMTGTVTTQDLELEAAPTYIVSGTVTEAGSGLPLLANIEFEGSPVTAMSDPGTGFYQATLPQGSYTMRVSAADHRPQERPIVVDQDQIQAFALEPLPCVLLVDDDNNAPNLLSYYTTALDNLGYDYDVYDVGGGSADGPSLSELQGYSVVIWFSGDQYGGTSSPEAGPNANDEAALAAFLDGGGYLFLSSQDYLYDMDLTTFGQTYLGISSHGNDSGNATTKYGVPGDPIGDGLGPYALSYPSGFTDFGDIVDAGGGGSVAFRSGASGGNNLDVDKDGGAWKTVFFGTSWVPIANANAANGQAVLGRILDWFDGCACEAPHEAAFDWSPNTPTAGETLIFTGTAQGDAPLFFEWAFGDGAWGYGPNPTHAYATAGSPSVVMTVTNACGTGVVSHTLTVLPLPCEPVEVLTVTAEISACVVSFGADLSGTAPFSYTWDYGLGLSFAPTPTVDLGMSGTYPYTLTVMNCEGTYSDTATSTVTVACEPPRWWFYLPLIVQQES